MPWIVVASRGARWGQVGLVSAKQWEETGMFGEVVVQFGSDGPFYWHQKRGLILIVDLIEAVEFHTGALFNRGEED